jgi:hypothetical protein
MGSLNSYNRAHLKVFNTRTQPRHVCRDVGQVRQASDDMQVRAWLPVNTASWTLGYLTEEEDRSRASAGLRTNDSITSGESCM